MRLTGTVAAALLLVLCTSSGFAQAMPTGQPETTWDVFGGGSYVYSPDFNRDGSLYGWDSSISQRPYESHPWIGGTISASGSYGSASTTTNGVTFSSTTRIYALMGGPSVKARMGRVEPFARLMAGALLVNSGASGGFATKSTMTDFAYSAGGGVDYPFSKLWALRAQADFIRTRDSVYTSSNVIRASVGAVVRF